MTRTVESPRGGHASLTITPGDDGVVYLRAANVVSEVTVPLLTADLLAAIADELGVTVVDADHEGEVRERVAQAIESLDGNPLLSGLVSINPSAQAAIEWAAATARGEDR